MTDHLTGFEGGSTLRHEVHVVGPCLEEPGDGRQLMLPGSCSRAEGVDLLCSQSIGSQ